MEVNVSEIFTHWFSADGDGGRRSGGVVGGRMGKVKVSSHFPK